MRHLVIAAVRARAAYLNILDQLLAQTNPLGIPLDAKARVEAEITRIAEDPDPTFHTHDVETIITLAQGQQH